MADKFYYPLSIGSNEWTTSTLVLPAVSVGNVGQLAIDLLINSLPFKKVGTILDEAITPVIGNDPYAKSGKECNLMTACEVFENKDQKLVVVQQRSPFVKGRRNDFVLKLVAWIQEMKFAKVILLGSTHAYERTDEQLEGSQFRYLATRMVSESDLLDDLKKYESESDGTLYLPGGGITKGLFEKCSSNDLKFVALLKFCMEGDNCQDSAQMANLLSVWLKLGDIQWKMPPSWRFLFGSNVNKALF